MKPNRCSICGAEGVTEMDTHGPCGLREGEPGADTGTTPNPPSINANQTAAEQFHEDIECIYGARSQTALRVVCREIFERRERAAAERGTTPPEGLELPWAAETMRLIDVLTPETKGKAFDPDWFLLRQRLEEFERGAATQRAPVSTPILSDIQPWPEYCFECDDTSRCCSAELCYAGHKEYPKDKHEKGQRAPVEQARDTTIWCDCAKPLVCHCGTGFPHCEICANFLDSLAIVGILDRAATPDHAREGALHALVAKWGHDTYLDGPTFKQQEHHSPDCRRCELERALADGKEGKG